MSKSLLQAVTAFADRQCGAISLAQLGTAGLSDRHVRAWTRHEQILSTPARGVFRMPGAEANWRHNLWVAVLAGPPGTVVSHTSAAALRGLQTPPPETHVTVPRGSSGRFGGAVIHHATVTSADRCRFDRLPVTGVARTVVDCAADFAQDRLNELVDAALGRNLTSYGRICAAWERAGRVRGGRRLEAAISPFGANVRLGSEMEAVALRRFREWGVPPPVCQYVIRDAKGRFLGRVDFAWPEWRFAVEYLGDEPHAPRWSGRDERRLQAMEAAIGWRFELADRFDMRPSATRLRDILLWVTGQVAA
ncbi:MAG TPA: hypothetical protein VEG38_09505 [Acidimicrobiia bacterium]|nr:hypothetical protein [Acidimicrobiia bacterium]